MDRIIKKAAAILLAVICIIVVPSRVCMLGSYAAEQPVSAIWPLDKSFQKITTYFNPLRNEYDVSGYHNAIDIEADAGANIFAPYPGTCISAGWVDDYGNMVILSTRTSAFTPSTRTARLWTSPRARLYRAET